MAKEPAPPPAPEQSDFPIQKDKVDAQIGDAADLAERDYARFGWDKPKPKKRPRKRTSKPE